MGDKFNGVKLANLYLRLKMACSNNELGATVGGVHYSLRNLSR